MSNIEFSKLYGKNDSGDLVIIESKDKIKVHEEQTLRYGKSISDDVSELLTLSADNTHSIHGNVEQLITVYNGGKYLETSIENIIDGEIDKLNDMKNTLKDIM